LYCLVGLCVPLDRIQPATRGSVQEDWATALARASRLFGLGANEKSGIHCSGAFARRTRIVADSSGSITRKTLLLVAAAFWPLFNGHFISSF
jgi:hypothetical protein